MQTCYISDHVDYEEQYIKEKCIYCRNADYEMFMKMDEKGFFCDEFCLEKFKEEDC